MLNGIDAGSWGEIIVGLIGILTGALLALAIYKWSKRKPGLSYQTNTKSLVTIDGVDNEVLEIKFKGQEVKNLALYSVAIRNTGTAPIRQEDWSKPLTLSFNKKTSILESRVSETHPPELQVYFSIFPSDEKTNVEFMPLLLNKGDAFLFEALISDNDEPEIRARIVDIEKLINYDSTARKKRLLKFMPVRIVILISLLIMFYASFSYFYSQFTSNISSESSLFTMLSTASITMMLMATAFVEFRQIDSDTQESSLFPKK
jgi:hypothetical protein